MMLAGKLRAATAGGAGLSIEDLFSTYLYEGNGSTQTITNGIDLAGEGGLVWIKSRTNTGGHVLFDTVRGATNGISSHLTNAETSDFGLSAFLSSGFTVTTGGFNTNSANKYASWTFRKAPRFFDVVTYTGTGVARSINHNLGIEPGFIITFEITGVGGPHRCWHRSLGSNGYMPGLDLTSASASSSAVFNGVTDTVFNIGGSASINESGINYVAYLFAHNDGDGKFGPNGDQDIIKCGSYTTDSDGFSGIIDIGFEPQFVMFKRTDSTGDWRIIDNMRGFLAAGNTGVMLRANLSNAESSTGYFIPHPNGFEDYGSYAANGSFIYIAIRRGPMKTPESGTEVFEPVTYTGTNTNSKEIQTGILSDLVIHGFRDGNFTENGQTFDRIRGSGQLLQTVDVSAEYNGSIYYGIQFDSNDSVFLGQSDGQSYELDEAGKDMVQWHFRRAPGFFDVVAYAGNATVGRTVSHNLGVAPEMMIVKNRTGSGPDWAIYYGDPTDYLKFTNVATADAADYWNDTAPTESVFTLGNKSDVNGSGRTYIAYLFATLDGVSKVGSYTGNGSSQTINCGFTSGARFVLIKRTDSTGDWYIWDTARGIVTGNDPHLSLNTTAAEVTTDDSIDPDSSGFIVNQVAATNINVSSASYIYLAIS